MSDWWSMHQYGEETHYVPRKKRAHDDLVEEFNHRWHEMSRHLHALVMHYGACTYCRFAVVGEGASLVMRLCDEGEGLMSHAFVNAGHVYDVRDELAADGHTLTLVHDPGPADNRN